MIELRKVEKLADKIKWQKRFCAAYKGELKVWNSMLFGENVKFYVAVDGAKELGFIRINDKSGFFTGGGIGEVWNITDAYVKPAYRGRGVLREMILQSVRCLNVKMVYMTTERYEKNRLYYFGLGFTHHCTTQTGGMTWALLPLLVNRSAYASNDEEYKICA